MLTSLRRMMGMPVVWQNRRLGYVERALPDAQARGLGGVVVRRGIGGARWCAAEDIALIGGECVLLRARPGRMPETCPEWPGRAYLTSGQCAGTVTDMLVDGASLRLSALEISPGPVYRLMGRCAYAPQYRLEERTGGVVVPALLTWTQLVSHLGEEDDG